MKKYVKGNDHQVVCNFDLDVIKSIKDRPVTFTEPDGSSHTRSLDDMITLMVAYLLREEVDYEKSIIGNPEGLVKPLLKESGNFTDTEIHEVTEFVKALIVMKVCKSGRVYTEEEWLKGN